VDIKKDAIASADINFRNEVILERPIYFLAAYLLEIVDIKIV